MSDGAFAEARTARQRARHALAPAVAVLALAGCVPTRNGAVTPRPEPIVTASPSPAPAATPPAQPRHVFVIVMENKAPARALTGTFTASLATTYARLGNYRAISHPSLPNYLAMTSGSTWDIRDDGYYKLPRGGLGKQLDDAGISWKAYTEGLTAGCYDSGYPYALKHMPFAYYGGSCPSNVVPLEALDGDLLAGTPFMSWITPGLCNDTHQCPVATGDAWLRGIVPKITAADAWRREGVLLIVWDEDDGDADNQVLALVVAPRLVAHTSGRAYDHYSLLATIEDRLGVSRLGLAADAAAFDDVIP